jgi:ribonuclease BN (tRNA processing enzyme)
MVERLASRLVPTAFTDFCGYSRSNTKCGSGPQHHNIGCQSGELFVEKASMALKITILGSGTCVPQLKRSSCAVLVETETAKIVLDLGPGTMHRMLACGVTIFDLTHICLSHFHPDHTAELVPLLFATKYPDAKQRRAQLQVLGGSGLFDFYGRLQVAYGEWIVLPPEQLRMRELDVTSGQLVEFEDFRLISAPVRHRPESLAYRIETKTGAALVYSGDTDECEPLVDLARGADLMICESAMPDQSKVPLHLTPSLAGKIAHRAKAGKLVLTHLYPPCDAVDIVKQAGSAYKGEVVAAEDLMQFWL